MLEQPFTRREFILALAAGAQLTATNFIVGSVVEKSQQANVESADLNNVHLTTLIVEHGSEPWNLHQSLISELIQQNNVIVPEYFPYEYVENGNSLTRVIAATYKKDNELFDHVIELCKQQQKDVWVLDPAYNLEFGLLRPLSVTTQVSAEAIITGVTQKLLVSDEGSQLDFDDSKRRTLQRIKNSGKWIIGSVLGAELSSSFAGGVAGFANVFGWSTEAQIRRVIVADLLCKLSTQLPEGTNMLMIYPEAHWKDIKSYVEDEAKRSQLLAAVNLIRTPATELWFEGRHYKSDDSINWQKLPSIKV